VGHRALTICENIPGLFYILAPKRPSHCKQAQEANTMSTISSWLSDHDVIHLRTVLVGLFLALLIDFNARIRRMIASLVARLQISRLARQHHVDDSTRTVSGIFIYPVKSLRAVSLTFSKLDKRGLVGDRRFMVVCENPPSIYGVPQKASHKFLTQRQCPALATIDATLSESTLTLSNESKSCEVNPSVVDTSDKMLRARIWDDIVKVVDAGDEAAAFLQSIVDVQGVRLVCVASSDDRTADEKYVPPEARTWTGGIPLAGLTDGFPILVACTASLEEVNRRLVQKGKTPIPMSRFRPNVVIETTVPFEEDNWKVIQVGDAILHLVKGCPRCKQSCTDQTSGVVSDEPLATLADFRALGRSQEDVYFAQNAVPHNIGSTLIIGSPVKILKRGEPVWDKEKVKAE